MSSPIGGQCRGCSQALLYSCRQSCILAGLHGLQLGSLLLQGVHTCICVAKVTRAATLCSRRAGLAVDCTQLRTLLLPWCHTKLATLCQLILKEGSQLVCLLLCNLPMDGGPSVQPQGHAQQPKNRLAACVWSMACKASQLTIRNIIQAALLGASKPQHEC